VFTKEVFQIQAPPMVDVACVAPILDIIPFTSEDIKRLQLQDLVLKPMSESIAKRTSVPHFSVHKPIN
jgi:hypothetical protein